MTNVALRDLVLNGLDAAAAWGDAPLLIVKAPGADGDAPTLFTTPPEGSGTTDTTQTALTEDGGAGRFIAPGAVVVPLIKTAHNPFSDTITIGRARSNDVIIDDKLVSKLHCYFMVPAPGRPWKLHDAKSANGTFVNRKRLGPNAAIAVKASDEIGLGGSVEAIFIEGSMLEQLVSYAKTTWQRLRIIERPRGPNDTKREEPD